MRNEELPLFLAELKELTEIESPTEHVEGVREVSQWFARKAQTLGLSHKFIPMQSKSVADCLLVTNNPPIKRMETTEIKQYFFILALFRITYSCTIIHHT